MKRHKLLLVTIIHFLLDSYMGFFAIYFVLAGLNPIKAAYIATISNFIGNITQPVTGYISDKSGRKFPVFSGLLIVSISASLLGLTTDYILLFLLVLFSKLGSALFHPVGANIAGGEGHVKKDASFALFSIAGTVGYSLSQPIFSLYTAHFGVKNSYILAIPSLIVVGIYLLSKPIEVQKLERPVTVADLKTIIHKRFWVIALLYMIMVFRTMFVVALNFFLAKVGKGWGFPRFLYSSANMVFMLSGAGGVLVAGNLTRIVAPKRLLAFSLVGFLPFFFIFLLFGMGGKVALSFVFLSITGFILYSGHASNIVMGQRVAPEIGSTISGILMGFAWAAASIGPTVCALLSDSLRLFPGVTSGFVALSILPVIAGIMVNFLPKEVNG